MRKCPSDVVPPFFLEASYPPGDYPLFSPLNFAKVDDTAGGITEGLTAGCWAVGVAKTGNYMAATEEQLAKMEKGEYSKKLQAAYDKLTQAGAHYVIDSINDLPGVIEDINRRLACGEKP
ncbi:hypothetical protein BSL78_07771 [Apostichopus japonicus]|uniref:Phosphonoacetaldehyde hydrolase n=1 Tax=Stichopus japonicus TaxID=307972 RepID=A0A2G8L507_STIJA|nr:hypothetical protein BSL78_07771 [Apostichopus japonicus]